MGQGRHHGERAFEAFLRARRTPYVSVNEARRALVPGGEGACDLKSFDFVVYGGGGGAGGAGMGAGWNLLVDVKCRRLPVQRTGPVLRVVGADGVSRPAAVPARAGRRARLESWATREDVRSLRAWQGLFGAGFRAAFLFVYWSDALGGDGQPPDGLFDEVFAFEQRWYAVRGVLLDDYEPAMKDRSVRWRTVDLPAPLFERLSEGFGRRWLAGRAALGPHYSSCPAAAAGR
ncbi:MAG TPA: HYExAFE family protein [Phycisphaerales bacterium]|nr:HYExAFE family protein [Phycisphaerales bacterium]